MSNKAPQLLRYTEWTDGLGNWYCNDISDLCSVRALWATPAYMLNISPAEYVELLVKKYKPDKIYYNKEADVLVYSWRKQADMRAFKNWLNAEARKRNFII